MAEDVVAVPQGHLHSVAGQPTIPPMPEPINKQHTVVGDALRPRGSRTGVPPGLSVGGGVARARGGGPGGLPSRGGDPHSSLGRCLSPALECRELLATVAEHRCSDRVARRETWAPSGARGRALDRGNLRDRQSRHQASCPSAASGSDGPCPVRSPVCPHAGVHVLSVRPLRVGLCLRLHGRAALPGACCADPIARQWGGLFASSHWRALPGRCGARLDHRRRNGGHGRERMRPFSIATVGTVIGRKRARQ